MATKIQLKKVAANAANGGAIGTIADFIDDNNLLAAVSIGRVNEQREAAKSSWFRIVDQTTGEASLLRMSAAVQEGVCNGTITEQHFPLLQVMEHEYEGETYYTATLVGDGAKFYDTALLSKAAKKAQLPAKTSALTAEQEAFVL